MFIFEMFHADEADFRVLTDLCVDGQASDEERATLARVNEQIQQLAERKLVPVLESYRTEDSSRKFYCQEKELHRPGTTFVLVILCVVDHDAPEDELDIRATRDFFEEAYKIMANAFGEHIDEVCVIDAQGRSTVYQSPLNPLHMHLVHMPEGVVPDLN